MNIQQCRRLGTICLLVLLSTVFVVSGVIAQEQMPASHSVSEKTKEFLSDPARTGSLIGTIIAGAAIPNPLAPLLGSVLGFFIGKRSSFSEQDDTGGNRSLTSRRIVPQANKEIPSIAGLANSESVENTVLAPQGKSLIAKKGFDEEHIGMGYANALPEAMGPDENTNVIALPTAQAMPSEPLIGLTTPTVSVFPSDAVVAPVVPQDQGRSVKVQQTGVVNAAAQETRGVAPDVPRLAAANAASSSLPAVSEMPANGENQMQVLVPVEPPMEDGLSIPPVMNRPEQMVKTSYDHAGVDTMKRLRHQLAEACRSGRYEKPTSSRCYYLAQ